MDFLDLVQVRQGRHLFLEVGPWNLKFEGEWPQAATVGFQQESLVVRWKYCIGSLLKFIQVGNCDGLARLEWTAGVIKFHGENFSFVKLMKWNLDHSRSLVLEIGY